MKKLITLFALIASPLFAKCIIIDKSTDKDGNITYRVSYYVNADGSAKIVDYSSLDDVSKIVAVTTKDNSGLSKDADRTVIYFNADDTVNRIDYQVKSGGKAQTGESKISAGESKSSATDLASELDVKQETTPPPAK